MDDDRHMMEIAQRTAREKLGFRVHLAAYLVGCCFFAITWLVTAGDNPGAFPWFMFPVAAWGIGVAVHFMAVYTRGSYLMAVAEKEYKRLKSRN